MDCYITTAEMATIKKCKININDNFGIYSDKDMSRAIAKLRQVGDQHLEVELQNSALPIYHKYRVKVVHHREFFMRDIYEVHGWHAYDCDPMCFEEAILLEIELL